jgi:CAAX prenyl protease-like protein
MQAPEKPLAGISRHAAFPYVAPFAGFILFLILQRTFPAATQLILTVRFAVVVLLIALVSRKVVSWRPTRALSSVALGVAVFVIWIGPDALWPGYRAHWLFQNSLTGSAESSLPVYLRGELWFLTMRTVSSFLLVPILEELFWRGWMIRWVIQKDFQSVPLGHYTALSFWAVAVLFASEHGPYWEVGLVAGVAYNWWLIRTRSLADCILAHGVTNACLSAYVLATHSWQYWM